MKIINTGCFYFGTDGTAYHGIVDLSPDEYLHAISDILQNKKVSDNLNGAGEYPYLSKNVLIDDIKQVINNRKKNETVDLYALRVSATDYIVAMFKNKSRYHYKRQNYIIRVKHNTK
jgi:hypothetical protein